jgi:predicted metal-dependent hydrolase
LISDAQNLRPRRRAGCGQRLSVISRIHQANEPRQGFAGKVAMEELPEKYLLGIYLFNEEEFFECHDVLEELWADTMGESRLFIQGLIQAAVAMFHFGNENLGGARKMYHTAVEKLQQYPSPYMGIDLLRFLVDFEHCFQELLDAGTTYPQGVELRDDRVPIIRLAEDDVQA